MLVDRVLMLVVIVLLLALLAVTGRHREPPRVITAEEFHLVDRSGRELASIYLSDGVPVVSVAIAEERRQIVRNELVRFLDQRGGKP